jgi:predicted ATPase
LGVFVGGCTLEAVGGGDGEVLERLLTLVDHSLVREDDGAGEPRFGLLETIRTYATERLQERADQQALRERHAAYYLALAETAEPALRSAQQVAWLQRLDQETGNLRATLSWLLAQGELVQVVRLGAVAVLVNPRRWRRCPDVDRGAQFGPRHPQPAPRHPARTGPGTGAACPGRAPAQAG